MGIFSRQRPDTSTVTWVLHDGADSREGARQDALWALCGGSLGQQIRCAVVAVLLPEPDNPHDPNAIAVLIEGRHVGYLPREIAAAYVAPLGGLMAACGAHVALRGVIV